MIDPCATYLRDVLDALEAKLAFCRRVCSLLQQDTYIHTYIHTHTHTHTHTNIHTNIYTNIHRNRSHIHAYMGQSYD